MRFSPDAPASTIIACTVYAPFGSSIGSVRPMLSPGVESALRIAALSGATPARRAANFDLSDQPRPRLVDANADAVATLAPRPDTSFGSALTNTSGLLAPAAIRFASILLPAPWP